LSWNNLTELEYGASALLCVYLYFVLCVYDLYVIDSFDIFVSSPCYPLNCINMSFKPKVSKAQIIVLKQTKKNKRQT